MKFILFSLALLLSSTCLAQKFDADCCSYKKITGAIYLKYQLESSDQTNSPKVYSLVDRRFITPKTTYYLFYGSSTNVITSLNVSCEDGNIISFPLSFERTQYLSKKRANNPLFSIYWAEPFETTRHWKDLSKTSFYSEFGAVEDTSSFIICFQVTVDVLILNREPCREIRLEPSFSCVPERVYLYYPLVVIESVHNAKPISKRIAEKHALKRIQPKHFKGHMCD